jgi:hypothetical protein
VLDFKNLYKRPFRHLKIYIKEEYKSKSLNNLEIVGCRVSFEIGKLTKLFHLITFFSTKISKLSLKLNSSNQIALK